MKVRFGFKAERSVMRKSLPNSGLSLKEYISLNKFPNNFCKGKER
jgi:hypothetical protein